MKQPRGTIRERGSADDLSLDDIIIEDMSAGTAEPAVMPDAAAEVSADLHVEALPSESISIIGEQNNDSPDTPVRVDTGGILDLESLTTEIDRIDRVVPEKRTSPAVPYDHGDKENTAALEDFSDVREINLDDVMGHPARDGAQPVQQAARVEKTGETHNGGEDIPYDLIDDEFIILEDERGDHVSMSVAEGADGTVRGDVPPEDVLSGFAVGDDAIAGSIIDENLVTEKKPAQKPVPQRKSGELTIQIPEKVRKNLPKNFRMSDLTPVDLAEAEQIAREDILLLKEEDLIEELDAIDLVPLDEEPNAGEIPVYEDDTSFESSGEDLAGEVESSTGVGNRESAGEVTVPAVEVVEVEEVIEPVAETADLAHETVAVSKSVDRTAEDIPEFKAPVNIINETETPAVEERPEAHARPILLEEENLPAADTEAISVEEERAIEIDALSEMPESTRGENMAPGDVAHIQLTARPAFETPRPLEPQPAATEMPRITVRESIPEGLAAHAGEKNIYIIDDVAVEKEIQQSESIFEENNLEKITSGMVEVVEGESKYLREASTEEDQDQIAAIMSGTALAFEDLLIDFEDEYKFSDDETGFIDSSFVSDAFLKYDSAEVGMDPRRKRAKDTIALEIFGLADHEISDIENGVFARDFKGIDLTEVPRAAKPGLDQAPEDYQLSRKYAYLGSSAENMNKAEKASVEEDLTGAEAVIFEENADDIRRILANYRKKRKAPAGGVQDISDEIVIIEDSGDVERFAGTVSSEKRQNIKALLKYLDGLFEKLPEDVIRRFADSEYYNLYVKVLNELDR